MKILVITNNPFSKVLNNGKTFESLFGPFAKNELCQLYFRPTGAETDDLDFCSSSYAITDMDVIKRLMLKSKKCGGVVNAGNKNIDTRVYHKSASNIIKRIAPLRDLFWAMGTWKTAELRKWCLENKPDCIFFGCGNMSFSHRIARSIAVDLNIPLVLYFGDDYLINTRYTQLWDRIQHWRMKKFFRKTVEASSLCFGIGELMCEEYEKYFGRKFHTLRTPVAILPYFPPEAAPLPVISYFGGLHLGRWRMIADLASKIKGKALFQVYSLSKIDKHICSAFAEAGVVIKGKVVNEELQRAIYESDILLHVESDDAYYRSVTKLSISTKIPEYLASGRAILGFGPKEVASMRILSDNGVGIVVSSEANSSDIQTDLDTLLSDAEFRRKLGRNAYEFALEVFDKNKINNKFRCQLAACIESKSL